MTEPSDFSDFVWGEVIAVHRIGTVEVVEFWIWTEPNERERRFHPYVAGHDSNTSWSTLWEAVLHGIALDVDPEPNAARWNTYAAARVLGCET